MWSCTIVFNREHQIERLQLLGSLSIDGRGFFAKAVVSSTCYVLTVIIVGSSVKSRGCTQQTYHSKRMVIIWKKVECRP